MKILLVNRKIEGKLTAQIAHLVFADAQNPNTKKPKELFFLLIRTKRMYLCIFNIKGIK